MRFADKIAVVIGGNSGIGLATAQGFAREGAQVVITGRDPPTLAKAAALIGGETLAIRSDIADLGSIDAAMTVIGERHGRIDALFVNAGVGTLMKRMGEPAEIARAVLFLSSTDASFITGIDLFVDGGVMEL